MAQAPDSRELADVCRGAGGRVHALREGRRGEVHSLRTLHAGVQRDDGPRRDQPLRPGRVARGPHRLRRADPAVPGLRGLRVRLPDGRRRPGHDHRAAAEAAPHVVRQVPDRPALHRPGPSPGLAASAGRSTATTASISNRANAGCARRSARPAPSTTIRRQRRSSWKSAAWCSRPASRPSTPPAAASSASGYAANVLTNVQFERMLSASGPTQGHLRAPPTAGIPSGWPSSSASAPATAAATTTIAPRSAAWRPPRRRSSPRSTSRDWR